MKPPYIPSRANILCPLCEEILTREDVEGYGRCPYCDHAFDLERDLEDFLLQPVVRQWLHQTRAQLGDEPPA
jgi:hypothetical protein